MTTAMNVNESPPPPPQYDDQALVEKGLDHTLGTDMEGTLADPVKIRQWQVIDLSNLNPSEPTSGLKSVYSTCCPCPFPLITGSYLLLLLL